MKKKSRAQKKTVSDSKGAQAPGLLDQTWLPVVLLAIVSFAVYIPTLGADFVWDARAVIETNPYVHGLGNLSDVLTLRVMHLDVMDNNRPVFLLSAMIDWAIWGGNPFGFHLTNVLLHMLVTLLLFSFARQLTRCLPAWVPFFAALIFAVHPVNCEAVSEISYRKDLIVTFFTLAALNLATLFQPVWSRKNLVLGGACIVSLFLAAGVKENGVAGPFALVGYWLLFRRSESRRGWIVLCSMAFLAVTAFMIARFTLPPWPSVIFTKKPQQLGGSLANTLLIQPRIWACYFRQIISPMDFCADYTGYSIRNFNLWISLLTLLVAVCIHAFISLKNRVACLGVAVFWLSLLPVSNFIPIYRPMADRFLYLPMCGVALMLTALGAIKELRNRAVAAAALAAAGVLAYSTLQQEHVWHDSLSLWKGTIEKNPQSYSAANNLAESLLNRDDYQGAVKYAAQAAKLSNALDGNPFATIAVAMDRMGKTAEADAAFKKAASLDARYRDPESLVRALLLSEKEAQRLTPIAQRNL